MREAGLRPAAGAWVDVAHPDGSEFEAQVLCASYDGWDAYLDLAPACGYERYARELKHVAPANAATGCDPFWRPKVELNDAHKAFVADLEALAGRFHRCPAYPDEPDSAGRTLLRTRGYQCPLVAVANLKGPLGFGSGEFNAAGVALGLSGPDARAVVDAADDRHLLGCCPTGYWYGAALRRELERACGVAS